MSQVVFVLINTEYEDVTNSSSYPIKTDEKQFKYKGFVLCVFMVASMQELRLHQGSQLTATPTSTEPSASEN